MKDDPLDRTRLGLVTLWLFILLALIGVITNDYKADNLDINDINIPTFVSIGSSVARQEVPRIELKGTIGELINFYSSRYHVSPYLVACIIQRESGYNPYAVGDSGKAVGLAQFHLGTYKAFRKQMGEDTTDFRTDKAESIKTLSWALSKGYHSHWSVWTKGLCY